MTTKTDYTRANELLDIAEEKLRDALDALIRLSEAVPKATSRRMHSYIIPHIEAWLESEREISSIPDIRKELEDEQNEEEENSEE